MNLKIYLVLCGLLTVYTAPVSLFTAEQPPQNQDNENEEFQNVDEVVAAIREQRALRKLLRQLEVASLRRQIAEERQRIQEQNAEAASDEVIDKGEESKRRPESEE